VSWWSGSRAEEARFSPEAGRRGGYCRIQRMGARTPSDRIRGGPEGTLRGCGGWQAASRGRWDRRRASVRVGGRGSGGKPQLCCLFAAGAAVLAGRAGRRSDSARPRALVARRSRGASARPRGRPMNDGCGPRCINEGRSHGAGRSAGCRKATMVVTAPSHPPQRGPPQPFESRSYE